MMKGQKGYVLILKTPSNDASSGHWWSSLIQRIDRWRTLHYQRQQLASLSDDALKDIGVSRADIQQEIEQPFWHDPMKR